jgi:hypothetical protein
VKPCQALAAAHHDGQVIVFETLLALLYGFMWERRWRAGLDGWRWGS